MKKVLIGMSGGIDSSVGAILLKNEGYEVIGATMVLFDSDNQKVIRQAILLAMQAACAPIQVQQHKVMQQSLCEDLAFVA